MRSVLKTVLSKEQAEGVGARVRRSIGSFELRNLDPFLMLDEFTVSAPAGFSDHPHRGFETVTYMLDGIVEHEDFAGHRGKIGPGDLQWMTAARGIVHAEVPQGDTPSRGLQLWVNLPKKSKMVPPNYQELLDKDIPRAVSADGLVKVKVIAGESLGVSAKVRTITPIQYLDVQMKQGSKFEQPIPANWTAFAYTLTGTGLFGSKKTLVKPHHALVIGNDGDSFPVEATDQDLHFVLLAGEPINEPIFQHGPFVMNTKEEIMQAIMDYQSARNGFEKAATWESEIGKRVM